MDTDIKTIQNDIKKLEDEYNSLNKSLEESRQDVISKERSLLACLQKLMPIQNLYLTSIISSLQSKLKKSETVVLEEPHQDNIKSVLPELETMSNSRQLKQRKPSHTSS